MPIDVLEKQIKALPPEYYEDLVDYVDYLTQKVAKKILIQKMLP